MRRIDAELAMASAAGDRVILLVTGKPPRGTRASVRSARRDPRGVGDWLAASRHAGRIAAVRGAHPRHGGAGALYLILRRPITDRLKECRGRFPRWRSIRLARSCGWDQVGTWKAYR